MYNWRCRRSKGSTAQQSDRWKDLSYSGGMDRPKHAQRIRDLRLSKGLTLEELARRVGVSKETVRLWEGGRVLKGPNLIRLAKELGAPPEELAGDDSLLELLTSGTLEDPYPSRQAFLRAVGGHMTEAEVQHVLSLRYEGDPGESHWTSELFRYREVNERIREVREAAGRPAEGLPIGPPPDDQVSTGANPPSVSTEPTWTTAPASARRRLLESKPGWTAGRVRDKAAPKAPPTKPK